MFFKKECGQQRHIKSLRVFLNIVLIAMSCDACGSLECFSPLVCVNAGKGISYLISIKPFPLIYIKQAFSVPSNVDKANKNVKKALLTVHFLRDNKMCD
jgi:hypothetical protein